MTSTTVAHSPGADLHLKYKLYGWGNLRCGGILSRPLFAYIILCICTFVQNFSVNGANNAVISTIERVFYLDSVQSGMFLALYDLATVFSAPLIGYFGVLYSSPMFFSLNMIIVAFGNILIASSNFVNRDNSFNVGSEYTQNVSSLNNVLFQCLKDPFHNENITDITCLTKGNLLSAAQHAKILLYLGNFVNGIGSVALFTIGVAYIERIFPREKAAYCQGIYFAVGTVGGALGIVATGRFLLLYTKLTSKKELPSWLTPTHPLWVGCWWLPYIIYGSLCFLVGLIVSGLPNYEIPGETYLANKKNTNSPKISAQNQSHHHRQNSAIIRKDSPTGDTTITTCPPTPGSNQTLSESRSDLQEQKPLASPSSTIEKAAETDGILNHAFSTETTYDQIPVADPPVSIATSPPNPPLQQITFCESLKNMCAVVGILMRNTRFIFIVISNLFEGILIKGFVPFVTKYFEYQHQLDTSTATLVTGAIALLSVIVGCPLGAYFMNKYSWTPIRCARVCFIVLLMSSFLFLFLIFSCPELKFQVTACTSTNAQCCRNVYRPVCNVNDHQMMFLSPCHFGCINQTKSTSNGTIFYSSCNCAEDVMVSEAACQFQRIPCKAIFSLALTGAAFVVFFTAFIQVPMLQVLLYCVPLQHQSMALGLRQTIVRVLGQTTGPLLFGFVFDQSCSVWLRDCYDRRTCKVYHNSRMGLSMALSGFSTRFISGIACAVVFLNWKFRHSSEPDVPSNTVCAETDDSLKKDENDEVTRF